MGEAVCLTTDNRVLSKCSGLGAQITHFILSLLLPIPLPGFQADKA